MSDWTAGYVADIGYTYGYYSELNPLRLRLAFLHAGYALPEQGVACELGFGQGLSVNIHAATSGKEWWATDFNPAQASFAQSLAAKSAAPAKLFDQSFAEFASRVDLPDFDFIGLHGIWSWVSDENRAIIVDFIRRKLKVGGALYISYNTQPGWAQMLPMRQLLTEHAQVMSAPGDAISARVDNALNFVDTLFAAQPLYARVNPGVVERIGKMKEQNRQYLAHEYFNRDWAPMLFAEMADWLDDAKVEFACSANYLEHVDAVLLAPEQQKLLAGLPSSTFRQTVRDFMVNQSFRRDYWVKGARRMPDLERLEQLREQRIMLVSPRADFKFTVGGTFGDVDLFEDLYTPVVDLLADMAPHSIDEIEKIFAGKITLTQLFQMVMILIAKGDVAPVQSSELIAQQRESTAKLNYELLKKSRTSGEISFLASPVLGGGFPVGRFDQMFLLARLETKSESSAEIAKYVWRILALQGQLLSRNGETLKTEEENVKQLTEEVEVFLSKRVPLFKALGVI